MSVSSMEKVLVIGGSGFMGSYIGDELNKRGYKATIFDRIVSPWLREDQEMIAGDPMDLTTVIEEIHNKKII